MWESVFQRRKKTAIVFAATAVYSLLYLYYKFSNPSVFLGIFIGLASIIIGVYSLESTTDQLKLMQTDYWNVRGIDLRNKGKYDDAIEAYNKAINIDPYFSPAWSNKGTAFANQGNFDEAIEAHDKAITLNQQAAMLLNSKVYALFNRHSHEGDVKALNRRSAKAFTNKGATIQIQGKALRDRGDNLLAQGKYTDSIDAFDNAIEYDSREVGAFSNKGSSLAALGKDDRAIEAHDKAIELKPLSPKVWNNKGEALMRQKKYSEAIEIFDRGIEAFNKKEELATEDGNELGLNKIAATIWCNKGMALEALGKNNKAYNEAMKAYDKAIELNPQKLDAWFYKGVIFHNIGKYTKAVQSYDKALEINPRDHNVLTNKGWSLYQSGYKSRAIKCFDRSIDVRHNSALAWKYRGVAILSQDKYEALHHFEKATKLDKNDAGAWYYKGSTLLQVIERNLPYRTAWNNNGLALKVLYRNEEADAALDNAIRINPQFAEAWYYKGVSFGIKGEYEKAVQAFDKAIEIKSQFAEAWYNRSVSLQKLGRTAEANEGFAWAREFGYMS
jgi:tetratricopeptide (TPR) repeat protein